MWHCVIGTIVNKRSKFLTNILPCLGISFFLAGGLSANAATDIDEVVAYTGLSGSYLAARVATADNDDIAAVGFLEKSLSLDPENVKIKRNLFHAYVANGRIEDAVLLARNISDTKASGNIVSIVNSVELIRKRSWVKAKETLGEIKGTDLDKLIVGILGAWVTHGDGKTDAALKMISDISGPGWMDTIKNLHRGLILSASGNDAAAIEPLAKSVATRAAARFLTEAYVDSIEALARAQQRLGDKDKARITIQGGLEIFPNRPAFHAMLAALDSEKPAGLLIANPQQGAAEFFYNLGNALGREGASPFAQIYLQLARHLYPDSAPIAIALASVFEKHDNPERANVYYKAIADTSPYKRRAVLETAINLNTLKNVDEAIVMLKSLVDEKPDDLIPYMTLGRLLNQHERYGEAADIFDKALALIPQPKRQHWDYYYRRAIAYERLKKWDIAEASFKKALELDPERATVLNYLGYSWVDKGIHLDEGLDMIKKAVKLRPSAGFIVDSLGWAYFKLKRYDEAVDELEKAIALSGMTWDPVVNDHLGDAYWKTGRKIEAKFQWQHALDAKPDTADRVKIIEKLKSGMVDTDEKPVVATE